MRPSALRVVTLISAGLSLVVGTAGAQDVVSALRIDSVDWRPWEVAGIRLGEPQLRRLGVCANLAELGRDYFHAMDLDADGRADLVYSGPNFRCDTNGEGENTTIYLSRGTRLRKTTTFPGSVVKIVRLSPWSPPVLILRNDGCCGDPFFDLTTYVPVRRAGDWAYEATSTLMGTWATALPTTTLLVPRPFTVTQDRYSLRLEPVVDDTTEGPMMAAYDRPGNVQATFARGSRGTAYAEQVDATGRTWWFVVMRGPEVGWRAPRPGAEPPWQVGWMSSRFLAADSVGVSGTIDSGGAATARQP